MGFSANRPLWAWLLVGALGYLALPWYAAQDSNGLLLIGQGFGDEHVGNGLMQALAFGRPWLLLGVLGLALSAVGAAMAPGRAQGAWVLAGGVVGLAGLLVSGFAIGARGWAFDGLNSAWGELAARQLGMGWGAAVALAALAVLAAFGLARRGLFRGDLFVSAAVVVSGALLALFIVFPVLKALSAAVFTEEGQASAGVLWERLFNARNFGLGCLAGGPSCGVAWNTLLLALMTAASTTVLGTLMALMA